MQNQLEYWQSGPIEGVQPLLQPVAHAILQTRKELLEAVNDFTENKLWLKPDGMASVGFHLQHILGVLDRLFTYARGSQLSPEQLEYLSKEGNPDEGLQLSTLIHRINKQTDLAIDQLKSTTLEDLLTPREIGRKKIPSNTIGLLFHAAEHCQRHLGQLLVTVRWVKNIAQ